MVRDSRWGWMDSRETGYLANISTQKRGKEPEFLDGKKTRQDGSSRFILPTDQV